MINYMKKNKASSSNMNFTASNGALGAREGYTSSIIWRDGDGIKSTRPSVSSPLCPSPSPPFTRNFPDPDSDLPDPDPCRAPTTSSASSSSSSTASSSTLPAVLDLTPHGGGTPRPRPPMKRTDIPRMITVVLAAKTGVGSEIKAGGINKPDERRQHHPRANHGEEEKVPRDFDYHLPPNVIPCSFDAEDDDGSGISIGVDEHDGDGCRYHLGGRGEESLEEEEEDNGGDGEGEEEEGPHLLLRASFTCYSTEEGEAGGDVQEEEGSEDAVAAQNDLARLDDFLPPLLSPPPSPLSPRFGLPHPPQNRIRDEEPSELLQKSASTGSHSSSSSCRLPPQSHHPAPSSPPADEKLSSKSGSGEVDVDDYISFPPGTIAATSFDKNRHTASTFQSFSSSGSSNSNRISQPTRITENECSDELALFSCRRLVERLRLRSNSQDGSDANNVGYGHDRDVVQEDLRCEDDDEEEGGEMGPHLLYCDYSASCSCDGEGECDGNIDAYSGRQAADIGGEETNRPKHQEGGLIMKRPAAKVLPLLDAIWQGVDLYEQVQPCNPTSCTDHRWAQKKPKPVAAGIRSAPARLFGTMTRGRDRHRRARATTPEPAPAPVAKETATASSSVATEKGDTRRLPPKLPPPLSRRCLARKKGSFIKSAKKGAINTTRRHEERSCQQPDNNNNYAHHDCSYALSSYI